MSSNPYFDDEASEAPPASDISTDEEGEFLSDVDEIHSSDLSENQEEEEEEDEELEEDDRARRHKSKKRKSRSKKHKNHRRKRRHRYLTNESSDEEEEGYKERDQDFVSRRQQASSSRRGQERTHKRKKESAKQKAREVISKKRAVPVGRYEDDGSDSAEISERSRPNRPSKRRSRTEEKTLPFHSPDRATSSKQKGTKPKKNKRSLESYDSEDSPRRSPSKTAKRKKKRTPRGPALRALREKIEASGFTFKLFKGRMSAQDTHDTTSPTQSFKVLIKSRAHIIGLPKELLRKRENTINPKKPWVRYDAHAFSPKQIFNFLDNLMLSNLISSDECDYIKLPKKQEGIQSISESFFLVIPHFRKEEEIVLFVVPDDVVRLASLWHATKMLDMAMAGETEQAVAIGNTFFEMNPPLAYFNQKWPRIKEALQQVSPEQEDLTVMLKIFTDIKGLGDVSSPNLGPDQDAKQPSQDAKKEEGESQDSSQLPSMAPALTTPVLLDHPLLSTLIRKQEFVEKTLQKILGVLEDSKELLSKQNGTLVSALLQSKTHLDDIERAVDRSTPASIYKAPAAQASPNRPNGTHSSPNKGHGANGASKKAASKRATCQEPAAQMKADVSQALLHAAATSPQPLHHNTNSSPLKANYSSQVVSEMLESI